VVAESARRVGEALGMAGVRLVTWDRRDFVFA
jgi:hypothetical protein